jgi:hypothetical protein
MPRTITGSPDHRIARRAGFGSTHHDAGRADAVGHAAGDLDDVGGSEVD